MRLSHVYVRALALGCFYSHISTRTFRTASLDSCAEISPFSGVIKSGRVWRKPGTGKRCSECGPHSDPASLSDTLLSWREDVVNQCLVECGSNNLSLLSPNGQVITWKTNKHRGAEQVWTGHGVQDKSFRSVFTEQSVPGKNEEKPVA